MNAAKAIRPSPALKPRGDVDALASLSHCASAANKTNRLPRISPLLLRWFTWYCRRYVRRHFHSLRVSNSGLPPDSRGLPLVIYSNHASWWDPLAGLVLKDHFFPARDLYSPIDAAMLAKYRMFAKLGFFGVEQRSRRGAAQFLRMGKTILQSPNRLLAVTPQSRFADARERPVRFEGGLGHLAARAGRSLFVPMATEYVFWEERLPEILVRFGYPIEVGHANGRLLTPVEWTRLFEQELVMTQDTLAALAQKRDPSEFKSILSGDAGQGGIYDLWRSLKAAVRREPFRKEHGHK